MDAQHRINESRTAEPPYEPSLSLFIILMIIVVFLIIIIVQEVKDLKKERCQNVPHDNVPDIPAWILADRQGFGQRNAEDEPICPICLDVLPALVSIVKPCEHRLCPRCLDDLVLHLGYPVKCPICSQRVTWIGNNGDLIRRVKNYIEQNSEMGQTAVVCD
ncbi:zinc ion binding [Ciborinia camelliae]|nr:zinc ion binding [Ciborinia camelliae]